MRRLLICLALALAFANALVEERQGRQLTGKKVEQPISECEVTLEESGTIDGVESCDSAPDDPSKYANKADWNFRYSNNRPSACWINIRYRVDIEDSENCDRDRLAFGGSADRERLVLCGQRSGAFSIPVGPRETFTIHFESDYSVAGTGFDLHYSVGRQPAFPVSDEPRTLNNPSDISPTPTRRVFSGRSDFSEYVYPEYNDYPDTPRQFTDYQYYSYPDYNTGYDYPKASVYSGYSHGYNKYPDYPQYPQYPVNTGAYYGSQAQVKTGGLDYGYHQYNYQRENPSYNGQRSGSQYSYHSPQTNYHQQRQFARVRREAEN
ncbi:uncharacterized protein [Littorina saxatilis]|uniref:CUB domain-containing protein n=1 Tax=Littorina saxatilis TaxID=31220 RepID=A0AAN9BES7_9CAEN